MQIDLPPVGDPVHLKATEEAVDEGRVAVADRPAHAPLIELSTERGQADVVVFAKLIPGVTVKIRVTAELVVGRVEVDEVLVGDVREAQLEVLTADLHTLENRCHRAEVVGIVVASIVGTVRDVELPVPVHAEESPEAGLVEVEKVCGARIKVQASGRDASDAEVLFFAVLQPIKDPRHTLPIVADRHVGVQEPLVKIADDGPVWP